MRVAPPWTETLFSIVSKSWKLLTCEHFAVKKWCGTIRMKGNQGDKGKEGDKGDEDEGGEGDKADNLFSDLFWPSF